jgi:hypothetical protein
MNPYSVLLIILGVLGFSHFAQADVCSRSKPVYRALEKQLQKKCQQIVPSDLVTVKKLSLPHIHIPSFKDDDFEGLENLTQLEFPSLFHKLGIAGEKISVNERVFAKLSKLEVLRMTNDELGLLPDGVFSGLTSLRVLDLNGSDLSRLPKSILDRPKIQEVIFDGTGLSNGDFQILRNKLGTKLKG